MEWYWWIIIVVGIIMVVWVSYSVGKIQTEVYYRPITFLSSEDNRSLFNKLHSVLWDRAKKYFEEHEKEVDEGSTLIFVVRCFSDKKSHIEELGEYKISISNHCIQCFPGLPLDKLPDIIGGAIHIEQAEVQPPPKW